MQSRMFFVYPLFFMFPLGLIAQAQEIQFQGRGQTPARETCQLGFSLNVNSQDAQGQFRTFRFQWGNEAAVVLQGEELNPTLWSAGSDLVRGFGFFHRERHVSSEILSVGYEWVDRVDFEISLNPQGKATRYKIQIHHLRNDLVFGRWVETQSTFKKSLECQKIQ